MKSRSIQWGGLALIAALAASACGSTEAPVDATGQSSADAITVTDGRGEEVTLPNGPATRVVALEWNQAEMVVTLGGELVGLSDPDGYTSWVGDVAPLPNDPVDVGVRREPSIETVSSLSPDLIIGGLSSIPEEALEQMERIAPVALLTGASADDPIGTVRADFGIVAELLGKQDEADNVLADLDATIAENATRVEEAGLAGTPVVLSSPYASGASLTIRMHGPRTAVQQVADKMGLAPAWTDPGDDAFGLSNIDLEGLTELPADTVFMYWGNRESDDVVSTSMAGNALWDNLPFVQAGRVHEAAVAIWAYGGPASLKAWSNDIIRVLGA
ncbi:ABC transporter substrate-binding protein [Lolliginicoccus suaedae]|uniref:ABC transporter substrate-binding protein n=1 Tax=Lolliginicoccus suaedae TaxID=2605429 RepID=UPI0011EC4279|nr:iron-siderophore ABC transporter substrate-binding protein [Lolliginicoccus suaedae]